MDVTLLRHSAYEAHADLSRIAHRPLSINIYVQGLTVIAQFPVTTATAVQTVSPAQAAVMQS